MTHSSENAYAKSHEIPPSGLDVSLFQTRQADKQTSFQFYIQRLNNKHCIKSTEIIHNDIGSNDILKALAFSIQIWITVLHHTWDMLLCPLDSLKQSMKKVSK